MPSVCVQTPAPVKTAAAKRPSFAAPPCHVMKLSFPSSSFSGVPFHRGRPLLPHRDERDLHLQLVLEKVDELFGGSRKFALLELQPEERRHVLIDRLGPPQSRKRLREVGRLCSVYGVPHTDLHLLHLGQYVKLGQRQLRYAVQLHRVLQPDKVQPANPSRPPGGGTVLLAHAPDHVSWLPVDLGREGSPAHPRGVCLCH